MALVKPLCAATQKPDAALLDTLAAAYAAVGNYESAIDTQKKAVQKLLVANQTSEVPRYMTHLNAYRSQQSLLINYAAAHKHSKTDNLKVSLKIIAADLRQAQVGESRSHSLKLFLSNAVTDSSKISNSKHQIPMKSLTSISNDPNM